MYISILYRIVFYTINKALFGSELANSPSHICPLREFSQSDRNIAQILIPQILFLFLDPYSIEPQQKFLYPPRRNKLFNKLLHYLLIGTFYARTH